MAYKTEKTELGLLVRDVELMMPMNAGDKGLDKALSDSWFNSAVKLFNERKALGKLPRFKDGHRNEAPVIGRVTDLRYAAPWLRGDILITEPNAIAKFERGEMPSLSAEFVASEEFPLLWGVACTQGDMGHFDWEKEDFAPAEVIEAMKGLKAAPLIRCAAPKDQMQKSPATGAAKPSDAYGAPGNQTPMGDEPKQEDPESEDEKVRMKKELTEALQRIGDLEKGLKQAQDAARAAQAKPPVQEDAAEDPNKEMPMDAAEKKDMPMGDKSMMESAPAAKKPEEKQVAAAAETPIVNLQSKLTLSLVKLKDSGCPMKAADILTRLLEAKTPEEMDAKVEEMKSIPKWQDLAAGDGAKVDKSGKALPVAEQVKLYLSDCDGKGLSRKDAIIKLSKEHKELYKAWTGSEPR